MGGHYRGGHYGVVGLWEIALWSLYGGLLCGVVSLWGSLYGVVTLWRGHSMGWSLCGGVALWGGHSMGWSFYGGSLYVFQCPNGWTRSLERGFGYGLQGQAKGNGSDLPAGRMRWDLRKLFP